MRAWVAAVLVLSVLGGCRFREPEPSEALYRAAVAEAPVRPGITRSGPVFAEDVVAADASAGAFSGGAAPFSGRQGERVVAFRPPADVLERRGPRLLGRVGGRCLVRLGRVRFECSAAERAESERLLAEVPGLRGLPAAAVDLFADMAQVRDGTQETVEAGDLSAVCAGHNGALSAVGAVIRQLTDVADRTGEAVDDRAGVVVERLRPGTWRVCLVLVKPGPGAITLRRGRVDRVYFRGPYGPLFEHADRLGWSGARGFLFVDPESVKDEADLVSALERPAPR